MVVETSLEVYEWVKNLLKTKNPIVPSCYHDHRAEIDLYNKPFETKVEAANYFKTKGNELFKKNEYKKAAKMYTKGLLQLDYTFPESDQELQIYQDIKGALEANASIAAIKLESYESALHHCEQVLRDYPNNVKILYRKGISLIKLNRHREAKKTLLKALELDPENSTIKILTDRLSEF